MHTYIEQVRSFNKANETIYTVGYYTMVHEQNINYNDSGYVKHQWNSLASFRNAVDAVIYTNFLNGGTQKLSIIDEILSKKI